MKPGTDNLVLELTRKCPLRCGHCMRGDAQDMFMSYKTILQAIDTFSYISWLTLTGGEPLNKPLQLRRVADAIQESGTTIVSMYIATSATTITRNIIEELDNLSNFIDEKLEIDISNDRHHIAPSYAQREMLNMLAFCNDKIKIGKKYLDGQRTSVIQSGRGAEIGSDIITIYPAIIETGDIHDDGLMIQDAIIYVSATGSVHLSCDMSYEEMAEDNLLLINRNIHDTDDIVADITELMVRISQEPGSIVIGGKRINPEKYKEQLETNLKYLYHEQGTEVHDI